MGAPPGRAGWTIGVRDPDRPTEMQILKHRLQVRDCAVATSGDQVLAVGATFPLQPITSLGRAPSNTVPIVDTYASAQHALLTWRDGQWWLEDQGSRNGTLVNDLQVDGPTVVSSGDIIGVGRVSLKLELD